MVSDKFFIFYMCIPCRKAFFIWYQGQDQIPKTHFNSLPDMPILCFSSSAANKDKRSKYGQMGIQLSD